MFLRPEGLYGPPISQDSWTPKQNNVPRTGPVPGLEAGIG